MTIDNNHLLRVESQNKLFHYWLSREDTISDLIDYCLKNKFNHIGIYGLGIFGEKIAKGFQNSKISVDYIVESRKELQGGLFLNIPVIDLNYFFKYPNVNLLIVTPVYYLENIKQEINDRYPVLKVMGLDQVLKEL